MKREQRLRNALIGGTKSQMLAAIKPVLVGRSGALGRICAELCDSVCDHSELFSLSNLGPENIGEFQEKNDSYLRTFVDENADRIRVFVEQIPAAFHDVGLTDANTGEYVVPFSWPTDYLQGTKALREATHKQLLDAYQVVWIPGDLAQQLRSGKSSQYHLDAYLAPNLAELENLCWQYLAESDFASPELETALVGAMVHGRITEYVEALKDQEKLPAMTSYQYFGGPLVEFSDYELLGKTKTGFFASAIPLLAAGFGRSVGEVFALGISWLVSGLLVDDNRELRWLIFIGFTAARWIVGAIHSLRRDERAEKLALLRFVWDMSNAYKSLFPLNAALVKNLLYSLQARGADFKPIVFSILDRRERREAAAI